MAFVERRFQAAPTSPINFLLLYDAAVRLWPLLDDDSELRQPGPVSEVLRLSPSRRDTQIA
jgi:hypothetical protein